MSRQEVPSSNLNCGFWHKDLVLQSQWAHRHHVECKVFGGNETKSKEASYLHLQMSCKCQPLCWHTPFFLCLGQHWKETQQLPHGVTDPMGKAVLAVSELNICVFEPAFSASVVHCHGIVPKIHSSLNLIDCHCLDSEWSWFLKHRSDGFFCVCDPLALGPLAANYANSHNAPICWLNVNSFTEK